MWREEDELVIRLTKAEALDLFSRCLKSLDEDNDESRRVLKKLAHAIDTIPSLRPAHKAS